MVAGMEGPSSGLCVVCAKVVSSSLVSVYASLIAQNGSIHSQMGQVVGVEQLGEACQATEFVCSICLRLLLNIVNLECKVILLKNEFRATFQKGAESRREVLAGSHVHLAGQSSVTDQKSDNGNPPQDEVWNRTHLDHCVKPEKVEGLFSNIPLATENNVDTLNTSEPLVDDRGQDAKSLVKHEHNGSESSAITSKQSSEELGTQLALDTSADELSDFLPPHSLLGDDVTSYGSHGEEETLREAIKRTDSDPSMQDYPHSAVSTLDTTKAMECRSEGEKARNIGSPEDKDKEGSECVPDPGRSASSEGSNEQTLQKRIRKPKRQPAVCTPKRRRRKLNAALETVEVKAETEDKWTPKESRTSQLEELLETCELCGNQFSDAKQLGQHRREAHSSVYCHVCEWCPNTCYRERSKLTQHLRRIHSITAHKCPGCVHEAVSQNALDQHIIKQHPESRFFECHICHKAFRTHRYLHFVHMKRCHLGLPIKYSCEKCNKGFVDKSSFENHKVTHSGARNFTCEFCGARFLTPYSLKVHVNTHTREKKYECEDCGSAFLRMCNLCAHRKRFHSSSDVKLVCEICGKSMSSRRDLRRHQVAQHSKEKPFRCPHCARCYAARESLKTHLRTHTGEKPYVCGCGKAFHKSSVLRRHQRCVHEGEDLQQDAAAAEVDPQQVGPDGELEREEHMVVITLSECNPHAMYTVQGGTPHLQEILVSSEEPTQGPANASLLAEGPDGMPLLHSSLGTLGRGRLALSTPVLLTSLTAGSITVPDTTFATQVTTGGASLPAHTANTFQPTSDSPSLTEPIVSTKDPQEPQDTLAGLGPASCSDLLQLPGLHAAAATPVSLVTPWPSSAL